MVCNIFFDNGYHLAPIMGAGPTSDLTIGSLGDFSKIQPVSEMPPVETLILQLQAVPPSWQ